MHSQFTRKTLRGSLMVAITATMALAAQAALAKDKATATAVFANGCFWCTESDFEKLPGVVEAVSGYTGGHTENPDYGSVGQGGTGHTEAVKVTYDPEKISYTQLVDFYWRHTDVVDAGGQFCDRGSQYRPAIFVAGAEERRIVEESKAAIEASGQLPGPIVVEINDLKTFYPAEGYHQNYYKTNATQYYFYRQGCGRDARLKALWRRSAGS